MKFRSRICFFTLALLLLLGRATAQTAGSTVADFPRHALFVNFFGDASLLSVNYERLYTLHPNLLLSAKFGLGFNRDLQLCMIGPCETPETFTTVPHHLTLNLGTEKHFLEMGIGASLVTQVAVEAYVVYPILGYRYLPTSSGKRNFRIYGFIPRSGVFAWDYKLGLGFSLGISL